MEPAIVLTVMERTPSAAFEAILIETGRVLGVPPLPTVAVMPPPLNVIAGIPAKLLPAITASTLAPGTPKAGVIAVIVGWVDVCAARYGQSRMSNTKMRTGVDTVR
jgi:hypothetical protein